MSYKIADLAISPYQIIRVVKLSEDLGLNIEFFDEQYILSESNGKIFTSKSLDHISSYLAGYKYALESSGLRDCD